MNFMSKHIAAYRGSRTAARNTARVWNNQGHPLAGMGFRYEAQLDRGRHVVVSVKK